MFYNDGTVVMSSLDMNKRGHGSTSRMLLVPATEIKQRCCQNIDETQHPFVRYSDGVFLTLTTIQHPKAECIDQLSLKLEHRYPLIHAIAAPSSIVQICIVSYFGSNVLSPLMVIGITLIVG